MKKEMLINVLQPEECRIAIVEDGILEELYVERTAHESYTGNIYKGKIVNLEPAIQAAFVDFSVGRNGFLHVSDVEPQYYQRHLDAESPPPSARDRDRDRGPAPRRTSRPGEERDRPDRSERGRRDRSEPRRFGEGLLGEDPFATPPPRPAPHAPVAPPPPAARAPEPPPVIRAPEPPREEPRPPDFDEFTFRTPDRERPARPSFRDRDARPAPAFEPEPPRAQVPAPRAPEPRAPEPFDPDLPPSRTQRARPAPRPADVDPEFEAARRRPAPAPVSPPLPPLPPPLAPAAPSEFDAPAARGREREPRRGRGRGRSGRPLPGAEAEFGEPIIDLEVEAGLHHLPPVEPETEDRSEPARRRGGRAAIRSRGGEREGEPERHRERDVIRERENVRERPPEVAPERPRALAPTPPVEYERPPQREREREREVVRERPRLAEPEPSRDRPRPQHDRAGEPGYVPRRERSRGEPAPFGPEPTEWIEPGLDLDADLEPSADTDVDSEADDPGRPDGPRRRRRRRGRRRERERGPAEAGSPAADDLGSDFEDDIDEPPVVTPPAPAARRAPAPSAVPPPRAAAPAPATSRPAEDEDELSREFDFGDDVEPAEAHFDDDAHDDFHDADPRAAEEDDGIDPGLEDEIRREAEEIAELEREMGLRGTTEARPRRGDDPRDPDAAPGRGGPGRFSRARGMGKPPLQEIFRRGDEVLVQVIKESIGTKGPTLSTYISIPGRYLVLMPGLNRVGVSRKISDEGQRRKLRDIMNDLNPPKGLGFIVRTAGMDRTKRELARDLAYLLRLWKVILKRIKKAKGPTPIYQESDMITRTIRDIFTAEIDTIWIDEPQAFERAQEFLRVVMPKFVDRLKLYEERAPLFHKYGIEDEIAKIQRRHVPLPEGGSIVIDQTEALVAIDVNSGNFRVENDAERTAYEMNLRAAKEIARQLRLRDMGGVIVNDFIDMREERHRRGVEKALRDAIKRDRARTKVLRMSAFGLIEMTRQRIRPSLKRSVYEDCHNCGGAGVVKTVESMSIDVMRLIALASNREDIRRVQVVVCPAVAAHLNNHKRRDIARLEVESNMLIQIRAEEGAPGEHLQIECFDGHNGEIRLLPAPPAPPHRRPYAPR